MSIPIHGRTVVFIDGFNLYHSLDNNPRFHKYKWLDLKKLSLRFVPASHLHRILYFTAYADWSPSKTQRHRDYVRALRAQDIEIVLGQFKEKTLTCRAQCGQPYKTHEEKRTDVNIAVYLLELAFKDEYDAAMVITGDTDIIPAIEAVKRLFSKPIYVVFPFARKSDELAQVADEFRKMRERHLSASQLPNPVTLQDGTALYRPSTWV